MEGPVLLRVTLFVIAIGEALPPLHRRLHAWTQAHQQPLLAVTISLTAVGFVLLMGMAIHLVLAGGKPMSKREIDGLAARRLTSNASLGLFGLLVVIGSPGGVTAFARA